MFIVLFITVRLEVFHAGETGMPNVTGPEKPGGEVSLGLENY